MKGEAILIGIVNTNARGDNRRVMGKVNMGEKGGEKLENEKMGLGRIES